LAIRRSNSRSRRARMISTPIPRAAYAGLPAPEVELVAEAGSAQYDITCRTCQNRFAEVLQR
jgi:hypothetical protein